MAILPPANGSERRAVLYGGQEKTKSVLGVIIVNDVTLDI